MNISEAHHACGPVEGQSVESIASNIGSERLSNWICGLCGHELTSLAIYLHDGLVYIFSWLVCMHGRPPLASTAHAQQTQNVCEWALSKDNTY